MKYIRDQFGFSAVELLLAITVFGMVVLGIGGVLIYGDLSVANSGERSRALMLSEEGVEAVRGMRDADFANLTDGTYGLVQSGGRWTLSGTSDVSGVYTRRVTISTVDADRKTVTVSVDWTQGTGGAKTTSVASRLTNWRKVTASVTTGPIMMVYSKTTTVPFVRTWDGTNWSAEASAQAVTGNINYLVLKSSRTRNEAILGTQTSTGQMAVQTWNGTAWSVPTVLGTASTTMRSFDISYEKNSDRAVIAYGSGVDFAYRTWDGTTLSAAVTVTAPPTTGAVNWMELKQNPLSTSNEIAMILLDANADVYGMVWTGAAWSTMATAAVWDATAATAAKKTIDVEYEQLTGRAVFMWGDAVATDQYYRIWNGTTLGAPTLLDIPAQGGLPEWIQLAARPNSNEIMMGVQDAGADLNTRKWSGTAWDTATQHPEHSAAVENIASRNFDIVWETHSTNSGKAWLLWGDGATVSQRLWSTTAWNASSVISGTDDTSFVRLRADPVAGTVFATIYQNATSAVGARDINERRLTGGGAVWTAKNTVWAGPTSADPVHFRVDISTP